MNYLDENEVKNELIKLKKVDRLKELLLVENKTQAENNEIEMLRTEGIDPNYKRTKFGEMCLLLIKRILTMPKFSGYTYKDDFISNSIEKLMMYAIKNYDPNKTSKITNEPVKAFAYLTQIIMNAIIQIINERKAENESMGEYYNTNTQEKQVYSSYDDIEEELKYDYNVTSFAIIDDVTYSLTGPNKREESPNSDISTCLVNGEVKEFTSIFDIVKNFEKGSSVRVVYPPNYKLTQEEFNKISELGFSAINIMKYEYKYVPSFPKKQKKVVENELSLWDN